MNLQVLWFFSAYIAGSVNFSILILKLLGREDPRKGYSGNPGVTNVYRKEGPALASLILLLDLARSISIAALSFGIMDHEHILWAGFGLVLGNRYPCFHQFRGGKGVANYLGFSLYIAPVSSAVAAVLWVTSYIFVKIPFISSFIMISVLGAAVSMKFDLLFSPVTASAVTVGFIVVNHWKNIADLLNKKNE